jgi:predicted secreted protein
MELTPGDAGTRRTVRAGESIAITLAESATTGYRWSLDDPGDFDEIGDESTAPELTPGAAGSRVLRVRPRRSGPLRLRLVKRRRWEQTAVDEFVVDLDVADGD